MLEFNENDNLSTMDDKIHHWLEHEGKEHWPRFKEIRDSWKGDVELWEELNVWAYHKLVKEIENDGQAYWSEIDQNINHELHKACNEIGQAFALAQTLREASMVEGIKERLVEQIRELIKHAFASLEAYEHYVDEMLNEFGWQ